MQKFEWKAARVGWLQSEKLILLLGGVWELKIMFYATNILWLKRH